MGEKPNKELTNADKVRYIFRKEPETKFSRAWFFWRYIMLFVKGYNMPSITFSEFDEFWKSFAGVERALRDVIKEEEFKLPIQNDARRYKLKSNFQTEFKKH